MKNIIKTIFRNKEYTDEKNSPNNDVLFFEKENQEYFLVIEYNKVEILEFFESEKTNKLINFFDELKKQKTDIQKNTSLIILLNLGEDNLKEKLNDEKLKNQIFKIEEDEYFFRKYVIAYTDNSTSNLIDFEFTEEKLSQKIEEPGKFKQFQESNDCPDEYFLIMQLFVKLPFLKFISQQSEKNNEFESIEVKMEKLSKEDKKIKDKILKNFKFVENKDEEDKNDYLDKLEKDILSEDKSLDEIEFLKTFKAK